MLYCIGRTGNYCLMIDFDNLIWNFRGLKEAAQYIKDKRILRKDYEYNGSLNQCIHRAGSYISPSKVNVSTGVDVYRKGSGFAFCIAETGHWSPLYIRPFDIFLKDCEQYTDITPFIVLYGDRFVYDTIIETICSFRMLRNIDTFEETLVFE